MSHLLLRLPDLVFGVLLQHFVPASLLLYAWQRPQDAQQAVSTIFGDVVTLSALTRSIQALLIVNLIRRLNAWAGHRALYNHIRDPTWDWSRETVLITGGSSGIGAAIVNVLSRKGIKVAIIDLHPPKSPLPSSATFHRADITSPDAIRAAAQEIRQSVGDPTVLINNAGYASWSPLLTESYETVRRTFDANIISHWTMAKEFVPSMVKKNHGHVVTVASMTAFWTIAGNVDYSATKAGLVAFHEGLAQELRWREGAGRVRTSIVHPTWARTPLLDTIPRDSGERFGPTVSADEVANAVVGQLLRGESGQLFVPGRMCLMAGLRGFPTWMAEGIRDLGRGSLLGGGGSEGARGGSG
ncbi:MAG: hypothetical protein Q9160_008553 [Pyrenula sp. 1 TL-2023]